MEVGEVFDCEVGWVGTGLAGEEETEETFDGLDEASPENAAGLDKDGAEFGAKSQIS